MTAVGQTLYLIAYDGTHRGLWRSDGTEAGTAPLQELVGAQDLTAVGNGLYFAGAAGSNPMQLWHSDGTSAGTAVVGPGEVAPYELTDVNGTPSSALRTHRTPSSRGGATAPSRGPTWSETSTRRFRSSRARAFLMS